MRDLAFQTSRDIVIGLADGGIIVTSVLAGLTSADQSSELLINAGSLTAICGALVFGFSRFSSGKEAQHQNSAGSGKDELIRKLGLDEDFKKAAGAVMQEDQNLWQENANTAEVKLETSIWSNALATAVSFFSAGILALSPFFLHPVVEAFYITTGAISILLLICGFVKARLAARNGLTGACMQWVTGAAAIGLCYLMGDLLG